MKEQNDFAIYLMLLSNEYVNAAIRITDERILENELCRELLRNVGITDFTSNMLYVKDGGRSVATSQLLGEYDIENMECYNVEIDVFDIETNQVLDKVFFEVSSSDMALETISSLHQ